MSGEQQQQQQQQQPIDVCGDGSVMKLILREGEGEAGDTPAKGSKVRCHYTGTLLDGTKFDSSRDRGDPFSFTIGSGVIQGWSDGVATMKLNERAEFTIAAHKAYGESGSPPTIPGGATLKFDIELLSFTDYDDIDPENRGRILKKIVEEGSGWKKPKELAAVTVAYSVKHAGEIVAEAAEPAEFVVDEDTLKPSLEAVVKSMAEGETAKFKITGTFAAEDFGRAEGDTLEGTMSLKAFENPKDKWELPGEFEKRQEAERLKELGTAAIKAKAVARATRRYKRALEFLDDSDDESKPLLLSLHKNLSLCFLKSNLFTDAIEQADKALAIDDKDVKAHFRKGTALLNKGDWDEAKKSFGAALELEPDNKAAKVSLEKVKRASAAHAKKEKKLYGAMFK